MSSRKILCVIGSLDIGGTERHLTQITPRLKQLGWEPVIYCISRRGVQAAETEKNGVKVIGAPWEIAPTQTVLGKFFRILASCVKLFCILLFHRPKIVHFFLPLAYLAGAPLALLAGSPVLVMSRRSLNNYQRQHPVLRRLEARLHGRMNAILGNSRAVVEQLVVMEHCDPKKVRLIYNGIDVIGFNHTNVRDNIEPLGPSNLTIIIVANLIPYKGHHDLIDALESIKTRLPTEWTLVCVGRDDGIRAELENHARQLNLASHIRFVGERTDVESLLNRADIGVICSHQEGFSNAILEGMAVGLPMVATDVGGNTEAIIDRESGLIVPPHDPARLGAAILELASNPAKRTEMGLAARKRIEENFSIDRCVSHYDDFYSELSPRGKSKSDSEPDVIAPPPRVAKLLRLGAGFAVTCITLAIVLNVVSFNGVISSVERLSAATVVGVACLLFLGTLLASLRLWYMAFDIGYVLNPRDAMLALGLGQVAGALTFQYFGQIAARGALLAPRGFSQSVNILLVTYERFAAAAVSVVLAVAGSWYLFGAITFDLRGGADQFLKIMVGLFIAFAFAGIFGWGRATLNAIPRKQGRQIRGSILRSLCLTFAIQTCTLLAYVIVAHSLSPATPINNVIAASTVVAFAASLPISFSGWGIRELSAVFVLGTIGIRSEQALTIAVLLGALALLAVLILSAIALVIPRQPAKHHIPANFDTSPQIDVALMVQRGIPLIVATAVFFQLYIPVKTTLLNVNLADPIVILGGALFVFQCVAGGAPQWRLPGLYAHLLTITGVMAFAFFHGLQAFGWNDWAFSNRLLGWLVLLCYGATGALIVKSARNGLSLFMLTFVGTAVGVVALEIVLLFIDSLMIHLPSGFVAFPITGFSQNRNAFAFIIVLAMCGITFIPSRWRPIVLGVLLSGLLFAGSRAGFGATFGFITLAFFLRALTGRQILASALIGFAIVSIMPALQLASDFVDNHAPAARSIYGNFQMTPESSDTERFTSILGGLRLFLSHPIFGAGLGAYVSEQLKLGKTIVIIHSTPVWLLAETGLLGFLAFVLPAVRIFWQEWVKHNNDAAGRLLIFVLIVFGIEASFHDMLYQRALWLLLGAALAYLPRYLRKAGGREDSDLLKLSPARSATSSS